jgi:hypothetical protein
MHARAGQVTIGPCLDEVKIRGIAGLMPPWRGREWS